MQSLVGMLDADDSPSPRWLLVRRIGALIRERRLVTLTGLGGIGKSWLAEQLAERSSSVVWVALGATRNRPGVVRALREALGHEWVDHDGVDHDGVGRDLVGRASSADAERRMLDRIAARAPELLVLDGFEHLVDEAAELMVALADVAGGVVVTSRRSLGLHDEQIVEVPPLSLAATGAADDEVLRAEAVALWVDRVRRLRPEYDPASEQADVLELLERLDGIPLAIERAAAHARTLDARQILRRLDRSPRGRPIEDVTLQSELDASWALLRPWERDALAQLSVFRGAFDPEAAEAVIDAGRHPAAQDVLAVLQSLRDHSLLQTTSGPGSQRLRMYGGVRRYAATRLDDLARRGAEARHVEHHLRKVEQWQRVRRGRAPVTDDHPAGDGDLAAMIDRCLPDDLSPAGVDERIARLLRLDDALSAGPWASAWLAALGRVLAFDGLSPAMRARTHLYRGELRQRLESGRGSMDDYEIACTLAEAAGDRALLARASHALGNAVLHEGSSDRGRRILHRAVELAGADDSTAFWCHYGLARAWLEAGRWEAAAHRIDTCQGLAERLGDPKLEAATMFARASLRLEQLRFDEARAELTDGVGRYLRTGGDGASLALAELLHARILHVEGRLEEAVGRYEGAAATFDALGMDGRAAVATGRAGLARLESGDPATGRRLLVQASHRLQGRRDHRREAALVLAALGWMRGSTDSRAADSLFAEAEAALEALEAAPIAAAVAVLRGRPDVGECCGADHALATRIVGADRSTNEVLLADPRGGWFRPPGAERVDLSTRAALGRVLEALVERRLEAPSNVTTVEELVAAGWPGERIRPESGVHRVHVALSTLRKMGLRGILLRRGDGYLLDPELPVVAPTPDGGDPMLASPSRPRSTPQRSRRQRWVARRAAAAP